MRLFLCESGGHRVIVAAETGNDARRICAEEEIRLLNLGDELDRENIASFVDGWSARDLLPGTEPGIRVAWWSTALEWSGGSV